MLEAGLERRIRVAVLLSAAASWLIAAFQLLWVWIYRHRRLGMETTLVLELPQEQEVQLQRLWARRPTIAAGHVEESSLLHDIFPPEQEGSIEPSKPVPVLETCICQQNASAEQYLVDGHVQKKCITKSEEPHVLDASLLGDFPARYIVPAHYSYEFPVVGLWIDPRVVPGFRYRVRPLDDKKGRHLFDGRALTLQSIGRGYSRRLTFEADSGSLNNNVNYLWTDSRPDGLAFELEVVSPGEKFTLKDANHVIVGAAEVLQIQSPQKEITHKILDDGSVEKTVRLHALCKVEWFENDQVPEVVTVSGVVVVRHSKSAAKAAVKLIRNASVGLHQRKGFTLVPGVNYKCRQTTVNGNDIKDVPAIYTVTGLEPHEFPVVGTYIDPRIVPGFHYKVRPAGSKRLLFNGRSLRLQSVGIGYGKRITFAPEVSKLNSNMNYFWSDSHPDGVGFEPRAVHEGMSFSIFADGQSLGEATVFRADAPQQEEKQETIEGPNGMTIVKYIHVDVTCHVTIESAHDGKMLDTHTMRVSGTAVVSRGPQESIAQLQRIENVGLESQLNVLFVTQHSSLEFRPL